MIPPLSVSFLGHGAVEGYAEDLEVSVIDCVDNDLVEVLDCHELGLDLVVGHIMDVLERDAGDILCLVGAAGLLFHISGHGSRLVSEGLVLGELCLTGIDQLIAVFYIMNVSDSEAPAFFEEGAHDLAVDLLAGIFFIIGLEKLCLQRIMSAQSGIAAADEDVLSAGLFCDLIHNCRNLVMGLCGLLRRETAGIGHHVEEVVLFFETGLDAVVIPVRVDMNIMYGLDAGGVVIQNDDLLVVGGDLFCQEGVSRCLINFLIGS